MKKLSVLLFFLFLATIFFQVSEAVDTQKAGTKVKYDLTYPGLLPDHPLYKLKVLREKLTAFLINDPTQKIEYYLLETDKGILAASILVDKNEVALAQETALKAENNMTLITYEMKKMKNRLDLKLINKLRLASLKHQEVLTSLINRVPKESKDTFIKVLNFSKTNLSTINEVQGKKF